jgi:hypothetical protein
VTGPAHPATARPVVALYDGTSAARAAVHRAVTYGARTVLVATPEAKDRLGRLGERVDEWVTVRHPDLRTALDAARDAGAPWICVPSTLMPTEDLLAEGLRLAAGFLGPDRRGVVLHVVRPAPAGGEPVRYARVVGLTDLADSSGIATYAAASVAARAGASLDVVLLGVDRPVSTAEELARAMSPRRDPDRFELARDVVRRHAVPVRYHTVGHSVEDPLEEPVATALLEVERLGPDLLVVELGGQRLLRMSPLDEPDIAAALASSRGRLVANLLAWLAIDVAVVLDAVSVLPVEGAGDRRLVTLAIDGMLAR